MNTKSLLVLLVALPIAGLAQSRPDALLIKAETIRIDGEQRTVATGKATLHSDELRVTADEIVMEQSAQRVTFTGDVVIHSGTTQLRAKEVTLETRGKRVFLVSNGSVSIFGQSNGPILNAGERTPPSFATPFPTTETELSRAVSGKR